MPEQAPEFFVLQSALAGRYSLVAEIGRGGMTAWMAVSGRLPFPGPDANAYFTQHASLQAPSLASARPDLAPPFVRAVDSCLAKSPGERWSSAEALANALSDERSRVPAVPAPVRAFLREWDRVGAEVATAGTAAGVAGVLGLVMTALHRASFTASILAIVYLMIAALVGALAFERLAQLGRHARLLLRSGYDLRSLPSALQRELPARAEEARVVEPGTGRGALTTGVIAVGVGAASVWGLWQPIGDVATVVLSAISVVAPTVAVRALWGHLHRRNPDGLWNRLASGWLGRALFRVAAIGVGGVPGALVESGEPTVLAIGGQTRRAFAALPRVERERLGDVPALVEQLEREAMLLRSSEATPESVARLASAMAALDLLRLDLLKVGSGRAGASELTAAIERGREIGFRVDAIDEVNRSSHSGS